MNVPVQQQTRRTNDFNMGRMSSTFSPFHCIWSSLIDPDAATFIFKETNERTTKRCEAATTVRSIKERNSRAAGATFEEIRTTAI